ncbi:MAG: cyclic nucleotide-binding/CBS domain-containing protein [Novosphingobium sp.]|nr:cyclic nucleotide-binding/CBS domain-containing protein [Novosphingobium sp.]
MGISTELAEVQAFLRSHLPFSQLGQDDLDRLVRNCRISYHRRGTLITRAGDDNAYLSVVRSGAVELRLGGSDLNARLGEGESFGYPSLIRKGPAQNEVVALEDTLLYRIEGEAFRALLARDASFRAFFNTDEASRLRRAVDRLRSARLDSTASGDTLGAHAPIGSLMRRQDVVTAPPDLAIAQAARLMARHDVSTLPVLDSTGLVGIVTDKDLRRRVLATGLDTSLPLDRIMTPSPVTAVEDTPVLTALVIMAERHIHHLPVTDATGALISVVSSNDILARLGSNSLLIAKEVSASPDAASVGRATALLPEALAGLVSAGVDADHVSRYVSTVGEGAHRRLLELAQADLGEAPVAFALVCFGSLARAEQALGSDQDNGFIFAEEYDESRDGAYFEELASRLCDGLDGAGYRYCPGDIMATNPAYRRTATAWEQHFRHWIRSPDPQAILESTIFFDMRCLAGEGSLVDGLRNAVFEEASKDRIFLSFVARAAAATRVPLGFFRNFLLQDDADEGRVLDLKGQAIAPIVDLARTHALANATHATNTLERLRAASVAGSLDPDAAGDLGAAFEFVRDVRFRHQAEQIAKGEPPSNKLAPDSFSRFDREHLRDAFRLIRTQLDSLRTAYAGGMA